MLWPHHSSRCFKHFLSPTSSFISLPVSEKFRKNLQSNLKRRKSLQGQQQITQRYYHKQNIMSDQVKYLDIPDKSEMDKKLYKTLLLPNGLHALIISDPSPVPHDGFTTSESSGEGEMGEETSAETEESTQEEESSDDTSTTSSSGSSQNESDSDSDEGDEKLAACAILMDYGSFAEPGEYQGLAHFLEHMIFMGSEKYPEENMFDAYITKCGGFTNALTDSEDTVFYFEVAEKHLDLSLDYFTALMKKPLMKKEAMQRERCSVDSEFQQIVQEDESRRDQLLASLASEGFPHGTFSWGNLKTLKENVDDQELHKVLHQIRRDHYTSNRMYMCLQARLPIDELEALVLRHFADIPSNPGVQAPDLTRFSYRSAFCDEFHQHAFFVKPVQNVCKVELTWVLPNMRKYYRSKPDHLVSYIMGYEGAGSLCAYLRRRLWALELVSGIDNNGFDLNSIYSLFNLCIYLTDEGFKNLDHVLAATFTYVKVLAEADSKTLRVIFDEQQGIEATGFRFQAQLPAMDNVQSLVQNTKYYPPKDILTGDELYFEYNEAHLREVINHLNDFRFNLMVTARKYEDLTFDKEEKWFGTEYTNIPMPAKWRILWNETDVESIPELYLPMSNRFVTEDFTIFWHEDGKPVLPEVPKKLIQNEICELWFRQDDKFDLPLVYMSFYLISPLLRKSAKNNAMCSLYEELVKFHVGEELYPATSAGLSYTFAVSEKGILLQANGYNEKLHLLIETIAQAMVDVAMQLTEEMLATFVKDKRKTYFNTLIKPRALNRDVRLCVVEHLRFLMIDKYKSLNEITLKDLKEFSRAFTQKLFVQGLIQGNYREEQAHNMMNTLLTRLACRPIKDMFYIEDRTVQLPQGAHYIRCHALNAQDTNTVTTNYYQLGPNTVRLECILDLLMMFVEEPLFDSLRTKEQLGYHVGATVRLNYGITGYSITVNSQETNTTASHVEQRIEMFRGSMLVILEAMDEEDFNHTRDSLIKLKMVADTALGTEFARNWSEIVNETYMFGRRREQIEVLRTLNAAEIIGFLVENEISNMRKLCVQIIGNKPIKAEKDTSKAKSKAKPQAESIGDGDDDEEDEDMEESDDANMETSSEEDKDELFQALANTLNVTFLPKEGDASTITDIEEFKANLDLYPNPKTSVTEPPAIINTS